MTSDLSTGAGAPARRLVLVAGSGRSGTSLLTTILGMAGFHVPQPEVDADSTNPKGFGEPKWVVDFHGRLLRARRVSVWDSRPAAFASTAEAAQDDAALHELRGWLKVQFVGNENVVVKDPRISYFLPLWERAAADLGVQLSFATLLRHPSEAVSSAMRWYGDWQAPVSRTVSWVNIMLETELATRGRTRVFVRYDALVTDWSAQVARIGDALEVPALQHLPASARAEIDAFVDPSLYRQKIRWEGLDVPEQVATMTEQVWDQLAVLAEPGRDDAATAATLDAARAAYADYYTGIERIAQSSLHALRPKGGGGGTGGAVARAGGGKGGGTHGSGADAAIRVVERFVPRSLLRKVPPVWRARLMRTANKAGRLVRR